MKVLVKKVERPREAAMIHIYDESRDRALCGRLRDRLGSHWDVESRRAEEVIGSNDLCTHCQEHLDGDQRRPTKSERRWLEKLESWNKAVVLGGGKE